MSRTVTRITAVSDLEAVSPEWRSLWERCPHATPFQTPEWALAWWRHLGRGCLQAIAIREEGRLIGLAPLAITRPKALPLRRLALLGSGHSDYLDVLAETGESRRALMDAIGTLAGWDYADFQQLGPHAGLREVEPPLTVPHRRVAHATCPFLALEPGQDPLPTRLRQNIRYYERKLAILPTATYRLSDAARLTADLTAFFRLHSLRWRSRGLPGVFGSPRVQAFHREVAAGFLPSGVLRLHVLECRDQPLAMALCYASKGRTYYYGGGMDPAAAFASPGTLVLAAAVRHAAAERHTEFDFLRGEESYKRLWGCQTRTNERLLLWRNPVAGRLIERLPEAEAGLERAGRKLLRLLRRG